MAVKVVLYHEPGDTGYGPIRSALINAGIPFEDVNTKDRKPVNASAAFRELDGDDIKGMLQEIVLWTRTRP